MSRAQGYSVASVPGCVRRCVGKVPITSANFRSTSVNATVSNNRGLAVLTANLQSTIIVLTLIGELVYSLVCVVVLENIFTQSYQTCVCLHSIACATIKHICAIIKQKAMILVERYFC